MEEAAFVAGALVVGYVGSLITEWFREGRGVRREQALRRAEAQRQTLLELQEAVQQLWRTAGGLVSARRRRFEERKEWLRSEEFSAHHDANVEARLTVIALNSRVEDASLRSLVSAFLEAEYELAAAHGPEQAAELQEKLPAVLIPAVERSGELLRAGS